MVQDLGVVLLWKEVQELDVEKHWEAFVHDSHA